MPKVSKKEARAEAGAPLAAAPPLPMDSGADEPPHAEPGAGGEPSRAGGAAAGEPTGGRGEAAGDAGARGGQPSTSGAPHRPSFAPLSAFDQSGRRVEFRRVRAGGLCLRRGAALWCRSHLQALRADSALAWSRLLPDGAFARALTQARARAAGHCAGAPNDAAEERVAGAVQAGHREPAAGHAHEPEDAQGARRHSLPRTAFPASLLPAWRADRGLASRWR